MKKTTYILLFLLLTVFTVSNSYGQCSFDSNDSGTVTDANFTSNSSAFSSISGVGNSWTACGDGILDKISLLSFYTGDNATISIHAGAGNGGTLLGSATGITTVDAASINDRNLVFDFSPLSISITNGATYTWIITSGNFTTRLTDVDIYAGGSAYADVVEYNTNDFLFQVDIAEDPSLNLNDFTSTKNTLQLFPNPAANYLQIAGLTKTENYTIYNILGATVSQGNITNKKQIDIKNLTNGLYVLKLKNGNTFTFVKK
ncbi:T9SS type A sorting domain-containing protein [Lacinutrix sp. C3R15]|uniref:T9SS type A sorting domain-containing protein n=1 Tax=Flavobacteriaceae TaxID=49546 RepID=UPI001C09BD69|nr:MULTISPECIES: T9SS type A sorting domain-containing protein [Flavobacteriaceae]MBU2939978.1 T9SS type A sorting domain-containing protein [Lacinutrix sp. C3R15]MDO6623295.1 T9SS type A sorting domain-containing protein [Oceanihabitans sp. 1_MG-2023]